MNEMFIFFKKELWLKGIVTEAAFTITQMNNEWNVKKTSCVQIE